MSVFFFGSMYSDVQWRGLIISKREGKKNEILVFVGEAHSFANFGLRVDFLRFANVRAFS